MGCRIFVGEKYDDSEEGRSKAVLYDSVTGWAFGPIFDSEDAAEAFIGWCSNKYGKDPRHLHAAGDLEDALDAWRLECAA